jgi:hypothetical protein
VFESMRPTREEVQASRTRVDSRERGSVLIQAVVRRHDPPDHIVYSLDRDTSVVDRHGQVAAEVRVSSLSESNSTRHVHVETCENRGDTSVSCLPIGHYWPLVSMLRWIDVEFPISP